MTPHPSSRPAPGDPVVLVAEQRSPVTGRVYEIGERARVVTCDEQRVQLIVADATAVETLVCPRNAVAHGVQGTRRPLTPAYRRRVRAV